MNECFYHNWILIYLSLDATKVVVKKCCAKNFFEGSEILEIPVEEFRSLNIEDFLESLKGKTDKIVDVSKYKFPSCEGVKVCSFPNSPISNIHVDLLHGCNIKCTFCGIGYQDNRFPERDKHLKFSKEIYFETLYKLKGKIEKLRMTDVGEPLLYLDEVKTFFRSLEKGDFSEILFTSNGKNLDDELVDIIKNSPVKISPTISVNAGSNESRLKVMGIEDYEELKSRILQLNCGVSFVITRENLNDFIKFNKDFKPCKRLAFSNNDDWELKQLIFAIREGRDFKASNELSEVLNSCNHLNDLYEIIRITKFGN